MYTAADLILALQRRLQLTSPHLRRPPGEFPPAWKAWFDGMAARAGKVTGATAQSIIDILLAKVESTDQASSFVREWIAAAYSEKVLPVEIPKTAAASTASAEFGTVYDSSPGNANTRTFKRAFEAYDRFVEMIEDQAQTFWRRQIGA